MSDATPRLAFSAAVLWVRGMGCGPNGAEPTRLMARQRAPISDLPVPRGSRILEDESEDVYTGRRRLYVRHVYAGSGEPFAVRDFYRDRRPQYHSATGEHRSRRRNPLKGLSKRPGIVYCGDFAI